MIGYKGFEQDLTCRGFQFEVGKEYEEKGEIALCERGFHFCPRLIDVDKWYSLKKSRVCEIEASGTIIDSSDGKSVCSSIKIMRELSKEEVLRLANVGNGNSGNCNSGLFCTCNHSAGIFMSERISFEAFNKSLLKQEYQALIDSDGFNILQHFYLYFCKTKQSKDGAKKRRCIGYKKSWKLFWDGLTPKQKLSVKRMPHFDKAVFFEITGIKVPW
ncbi:MAG: DUF7666 domain-containing protein [Treponema sp.]